MIGLPTVVMKRHEAVLDQRGVRTSAVVLSTEYEGRWWPDKVDVRYLVNGHAVSARLTVWSASDFEEGSSIPVVFDPEDPDHAKPVNGWQPTWTLLAGLAGLTFSGTAAIAVHRRVVAGLAMRAAARAARPQLMRAESFTTQRGWGPWRSRERTIALWSGEADPAAGSASLYVPAEDSAPDLRSEAPVTVLGRPFPGEYVIILDADRAVWPRGRIRADPPRGQIVEGRVG